MPDAAPRSQPPNLDVARERFARQAAPGGSTTLYWMNGTVTKELISEQLLAMRDRCGFAGVSPLTQYAMEPRTVPEYLTEEYFALYGHLLDTAEGLGMSVVFYDDCDFPSGTAGNRMERELPGSLAKFLARGRAEIHGPGEAEIVMPAGQAMGAVARDLDGGERRVVTAEATWDGTPSWRRSGVGFHQRPGDDAVFTHLLIADGSGHPLHAESFIGAGASLDGWSDRGGSRLEDDGLRAADCRPMWRSGLDLPERFTIATNATVIGGGAGLAFGVRASGGSYAWRFDAKAGILQPSFLPHGNAGGHHGGYAIPFDPVPCRLRPGYAYDLRVEVDGRTVTTWVDGLRIAVHELPDQGLRTIRWRAPAGRWELQAFVCATVPGTHLVDYLDPAAVRQFIGLTYDRFQERFPRHFGTTIRSSFFDDITVMNAPDGLQWSPAFRERFQERTGRPADAYYPALWEDIGPETAAARVALYGVRNEMLAAGYPKVVNDWCRAHGMQASGHPASSYNPNPLLCSGDSILFYKHQGIPLTDYIHYYSHGVDGFKVPTSAAVNYGRPVVVCEIYGNFNQKLANDGDMLLRAGMECYTRGVNALLPHGTHLDPAHIAFEPEISWRNPAMAADLPAFNRWVARCESLLQGGSHVADIAVLYPIADLCARHRSGATKPDWGYRPLPGTDYLEVSRILTGEVRRDFIFLHPEVMAESCAVDGTELTLRQQQGCDRFRVLLLPACRTIPLACMRLARRFHDAGGVVIATTCLPEQSAEFGGDAEVRQLAQAVFGPGGRGICVARPDEAGLAAALDGLGLAWDLRLDGVADIPRLPRWANRPYANISHRHGNWYEGGNRQFTAIHKRLDGTEVYFFANSSAQEVTAQVSLRGAFARLERWDPHTGGMTELSGAAGRIGDEAVTCFPLTLAPVRSVFVIAT